MVSAVTKLVTVFAVTKLATVTTTVTIILAIALEAVLVMATTVAMP